MSQQERRCMSASVLAAVVLAAHMGCAGSAGSSSSPQLVPNPHFASPQGGFGISETNPVLVGGLGPVTRLGPGKTASEDAYLTRLRGPQGQPVSYRRLGSCCSFPTPNPHYGVGYGSGGLLDKYEITYEGLAEPIVLYLNMYDPGTVKAPAGLVLSE